MPTSRARHTITETPPVERALKRLRDLEPDGLDFKDLLIRGATARADELEQQMGPGAPTKQDLIERFLRIGPDELDFEAGLAVHDGGWLREL